MYMYIHTYFQKCQTIGVGILNVSVDNSFISSITANDNIYFVRRKENLCLFKT